MNQALTKRAIEIVEQCEEASLGYIDLDMYPHVSTRSRIKSTGLDNFYFSTDTSGNLSRSLMQNNKASLCFKHEGNNITLVGDIQIINDQDIKEDLWKDWFINHFKEGPKDPEYCVIKFTTKKVSLWVDQTPGRFELAPSL